MATHLTKGQGSPQTAPQEIGTHYIDTLNKREYISVGTEDVNDWLLAAGSGASGTWTALTDTPSDYIGHALQYVRVNSSETGLEFASGGGGGDAVWGSITGTLSDQTDLQNALNLKQNFIATGEVSDVWIGNKSWFPMADLPISTATQNALNARILVTEKGAANGIATLDSSGTVPTAQLPSYVSTIEEYPTVNDFPATGQSNVIYIALDTNFQYRWSGTQYVQLTDDTAVWGSISGSLSNQTDLQSALDGKQDFIVATNVGQYYRGDKTFQTLDKNAVLLANVDNTSDADKPVSTAQQAALDLKEDSLGNPTVTGYVLSSTIAGTRSWVPQSGGGGGATNFTELEDTPDTYFSSGLLGLRVNAAATAIEFYAVTTDSITETIDRVFLTPSEKTQITTNANGVSTNATNIQTNASAISGKEDSITAGTESQYWRGDKTFQELISLALNDVPNSYGSSGQVLAVNSGQTGLEFVDQSGTFDSLTDTPASKTGSTGLVPVVNDGETALVYEARRKVLTADLVINVDFAGGGDFANMQEAWNFAATFASGGFGITINILNLASLTDTADLQIDQTGGDYGHITLKFEAGASVVPVGLPQATGACFTFRNGIAPLIDGSLNQDVDFSNKYRGMLFLNGCSFVGNSITGGPLLTIRNATQGTTSNTNAAIRCESFSAMVVNNFKILGTNNIAIRVTSGSSASINHCTLLGTKYGLFVSTASATGTGTQDFSDGGTFQPTGTVDVYVASGSKTFLSGSTVYTTTRPKTNIDINELTTDGWFLDPSEPIPSGGGAENFAAVDVDGGFSSGQIEGTKTNLGNGKDLVTINIPSDLVLDAPSWTPAEIATTSWYDADDAATIIDTGGNVTQWNDKSGNGLNMGTPQGTPITGTNDLNGLNVINFGAGAGLANSGAGSPSGQATTHIVLYRTANTTAEPRRVLTGNTANWLVGPYNGAHQTYAGAFNVGPALTTTLTAIAAFSKTSGNVGSLYVNGTLAASSANSSFPNSFSIGVNPTYGESANSDIAEIVTFNSDSTTDRQLVEGYLAWKWGIESLLPVGHPYKNFKPSLPVGSDTSGAANIIPDGFRPDADTTTVQKIRGSDRFQSLTLSDTIRLRTEDVSGTAQGNENVLAGRTITFIRTQ